MNRISDLTLSMCGPQRNATNSVENPHPGTNMKLKAAECGLILLWVVDALERLGGSVPFCEELCAAGHCFCAYLDCIRSQPEIIPLDVQQHMFDLMQSAILRCHEAKIEAPLKSISSTT